MKVTRLVVIFAFVSMLTIGAVSQASATTTYVYCAQLVSADSWCSSGTVKRVFYNKAVYPGSGNVSVGIRQDIPNGPIVNRKFAVNSVATNSQGYYSMAQAANGSNNRHTINGGFISCDGACVVPSNAKASPL